MHIFVIDLKMHKFGSFVILIVFYIYLDVIIKDNLECVE